METNSRLPRVATEVGTPNAEGTTLVMAGAGVGLGCDAHPDRRARRLIANRSVHLTERDSSDLSDGSGLADFISRVVATI
jgi:hypothetical protein